MLLGGVKSQLRWTPDAVGTKISASDLPGRKIIEGCPSSLEVERYWSIAYKASE